MVSYDPLLLSLFQLARFEYSSPPEGALVGRVMRGWSFKGSSPLQLVGSRGLGEEYSYLAQGQSSRSPRIMEG